MEEQIANIKPSRPFFLIILCSLSVMSNLMFILINILLLSGSNAIKWLLTVPVIDVITEEELHGNYLYFILKIALHCFCIYAILLIFKLKRKGLFYYLTTQIALLVIPFIFLSSLGSYLIVSTIVSLIFTLFFVGLFSIYLPQMGGIKS